ncbi:uncharacterized protein BDV17DRAFT_202253 [Aspergillus undulatus]|uniref:uncharacterized protein n=1 Tax=Aspergillus undulatus TaxID=1810928 RepID=UPI003CCD33A4
MRPEWWPGEEHEQFTQWAVSQGIIVNGVGPARFPGRGLGMVAMRNIQENDTIVRVPREVMLTIEAVPSSFTGKFPEGTPVHALLAAFLCHGEPEDLKPYELWRKTWPTRKDFEDCMPILWPESLRNPTSSGSVLPPSISGRWKGVQKELETEYESFHQNILAQQEQRLRQAWESVFAVFPDANWETYSYYWLIVNTRSFHYLMPGQEPPEDRNDAMALLPFADYFNHSDVTCNVKFDGHEYVFRAAKAYEAGDEIFMSYGPHPNDFLLTEYGFYLNDNESETLYLDDLVFQDIGPSLQEELELQQYLGNYQVTAAGVCYRTEIAACIKYMPLEDWRNYVLGYSTRGVDAKKSEGVIRGWIRTYVEEVESVIQELGNVGSSQIGQDHQDKVQMLLRRWWQIKDLCRVALETVSC